MEMEAGAPLPSPPRNCPTVVSLALLSGVRRDLWEQPAFGEVHGEPHPSGYVCGQEEQGSINVHQKMSSKKFQSTRFVPVLRRARSSKPLAKQSLQVQRTLGQAIEPESSWVARARRIERGWRSSVRWDRATEVVLHGGATCITVGAEYEDAEYEGTSVSSATTRLPYTKEGGHGDAVASASINDIWEEGPITISLKKMCKLLPAAAAGVSLFFSELFSQSIFPSAAYCVHKKSYFRDLGLPSAWKRYNRFACRFPVTFALRWPLHYAFR